MYSPPNLWRNWRLLLAVGGGSGLSPVAPGTAGTALAWLLYIVLAAFGVPAAALAALGAAMLVAGVPLCTYAERRLAQADDKRIVWDEIAVFFTLLPLLPQQTWHWQLAAFAVFRLLDAGKPFPIGWLDKRLTGGGGIMADDFAAGMLTLALLYGVGFFASFFAG